MTEKPEIIGNKQVKQANERVLSRHGIPSAPITIEDVIRIDDELRLKIIEEQSIERLEAQRDADVAYYEPLIQQAKAEVARELMDTIEAVYPELKQTYWNRGEWQSLKDKFPKEAA